MSAVETVRLEMQSKVKRLAAPSQPGESVKACIRRVSRKTGLTFGEVRRCWYLRWRRIPADIADRIREASNAHDKQLTNSLRTFVELAERSDPDFYRPQLEAVGEILRQIGELADPRRNED